MKGQNGLAGEIKHMPLQVDWDNFDFSVDEIKAHIRKMVLLTMSFYDPETIVLYTNFYFGQKDFTEELTEELKQVYPYAVLPEIVLSRNLRRIIGLGFWRLGLIIWRII